MFAGSTLSSDAKGIWDYNLIEEGPEQTGTSNSSELSDDEEDDDGDHHDDDGHHHLLEDINEDQEREIQMPPSPRSSKPRNLRKDQRTRSHSGNNHPKPTRTLSPSKAQKQHSQQQHQQQQQQSHHKQSKQQQQLVVETTENKRHLYIYRAGKVSKFSVYPSETILHIKSRIQRKLGIAPAKQYLEWDGIELEEQRTIAQYGIPTDATLVLSKLRSIPSHPSIHTESLMSGSKQQHVMEESQTATTDHDLEDHHRHHHHHRDSLDEEERDDHLDDIRPKRRGRSSTSRPVPITTTNSNPNRPPKPPRQQPPSPTSYASSDHDSFMTSPSQQQYPDPRRRQQALLNKLKIQNHNSQQSTGDVSSLEHESTLPSRPRPKKQPAPPPPPPPPPIDVFVNTIMGFTINIAAKATDTVDRLKKMIEEQEDIPFKKQILILDGVPLDDAQFLTDYTSSSSLHVLLRLQAGTGSSVGGASFVTPASSTMAAVPRKKNRLLGRGM
ncbi:Polyubiquitin (Fragment) [Seminavis robusta]|uniref:Polyubiquitin n=1 Tax=Seminavis robusta TaxID=568900 RepID=A0A9N8EC93_9STRA